MPLTKDQKRKYAMGVSRLNKGIWGYKRSNFFKIHLTTKQGNDNSQATFSADFKKIVKRIREKHPEMEYCGATGYTPENSLLHGHFIIRIKGGILKLYEGEMLNLSIKWQGENGEWHTEHDDKNRVTLGNWWDEIHGAFAVGMPTGFPKESDFITYITQHIMKDYTNTDMAENRFLVSRKWSNFDNHHKERLKRMWHKIYNEWMGKQGYEILRLLEFAVCSKSTTMIYTDQEKRGVIKVVLGEVVSMGTYDNDLDAYVQVE